MTSRLQRMAFILTASFTLASPTPAAAQAMDSVDVDVLTHPVSRGAVLNTADFTGSEADAATARFALSAARATGMATRRELPRGSVVRAADLALPALVKRGEIVRIKIAMAGMLITSQGRALADAAKGQTVRVFSTSTNATLVAQATAPGIVSINAN